jgi:hypothetical protein
MRHLLAWRNGETIDPESGEHQVAHLDAACAQLAKLVDLVERAGTVAPAPAVLEVEPADPWMLPYGLEWRHQWDGWAIWNDTGGLWLRTQAPLGCQNGDPIGSLCDRPDADALIDLLKRRNAGGAR